MATPAPPWAFIVTGSCHEGDIELALRKDHYLTIDNWIGVLLFEEIGLTNNMFEFVNDLCLEGWHRGYGLHEEAVGHFSHGSVRICSCHFKFDYTTNNFRRAHKVRHLRPMCRDSFASKQNMRVRECRHAHALENDASTTPTHRKWTHHAFWASDDRLAG